jgi:replicative DNA helicase
MDKPLPADVNAERAMLGSILLDRDAIIPIAAFMQPAYCYLDKHETVFAAQLACYNRRIPPDLATVAAELKRRDQLEAIGGIPYLIELSNSTPTAAHVEYYARIVEEKALQRRMITAGGRIAALGFDESEDLDVALSRAQSELDELRSNRDQNDFYSSATIALEFQATIERRMESGDEVSGIKTGLADLDAILSGLQRTDLLTLAGRPGMGKSSLALTIAENVSAHGLGVAYFSLEMGREQLHARRLSMQTQISTKRLMAHRLTADEVEQVFIANERLSNRALHICDKSGLSSNALAAKTRALCAQAEIDLVIVDYLQLMSGNIPGMSDVERISEISLNMKMLARDLNLPVIVLSQLNRELERRPDKRPQLSDLRGSGAIEQDSDVVLFIYRDEVYNPETDSPGVAEIEVAKHRNGPTDTVFTRFEKETTRFANLETRYQEPGGYR